MLEAQPYRYQAALSDLAGSDIEVHNDEPLDAMRCVRNWLVAQLEIRNATGAQGLWNVFNDFTNADYEAMQKTGHSEIDIEKRPISEMAAAMRTWIDSNR